MKRIGRLHRLAVWMATIGYATVASGLPLPLSGSNPDPIAEKRLGGKDRSTPFPCMDKPCGCATAEQCFTSCCCHTPAETLAWAKANRASPSLLAALERRVSAKPPSLATTSAKADGCCGTGVSCEPPQNGAAAGSCCCAVDRAVDKADQGAGNVPEEPTRDESGERKPAEEKPVRGVVLRAMLACGGIVAQWCGSCIALPPTADPPSLPMPLAGFVGSIDLFGRLLSSPPEPPPPRGA